MRTIAALGVVIILGVALPAAAAETAKRPRSGLFGHATKGPLTPVCRVGVPCYGPADNAKILFVRRGHIVAQTRTDSDGDYRIALRPGRYAIKSKIGFGVVKPTAADVRRGRYSRADLSLDTGIR